MKECERLSVWAVFLNGAPISMHSKMQDCTTEAELVAAMACARDMLFLKQLLESIGLTVKKPMVLTVDNKGAKDLANRSQRLGKQLECWRPYASY